METIGLKNSTYIKPKIAGKLMVEMRDDISELESARIEFRTLNRENIN